MSKGENYIKVFDCRKDLKSILKINSKGQNECTVLFDRKNLDKNKLEADRFVRYVKNSKIYYIKFLIQN